MKRKQSLIPPLVVILLLCASTPFAGWGDTLKQAGSQYADDGAKAAGLAYTPTEATAGIKDVLSIGTDYAVSRLTEPNGFSADPATAFSLPSSLSDLGNPAGLLNSLYNAAGDSVPATGNIFLDVIQKLSISDASSLLGSGEDAITRYFEQSSRSMLKKLVNPIVAQSVEAAGVGSYLNALGSAGAAGPPFDATDFITERTLDGMFHFMALKEKSIRESGGMGTTDLIKKLF